MGDGSLMADFPSMGCRSARSSSLDRPIPDHSTSSVAMKYFKPCCAVGQQQRDGRKKPDAGTGSATGELLV
jgi:hypothetical protein